MQRFEGIYVLQLQGVCPSILKVKAECSCETWVCISPTTRCHFPDDQHIHMRRREKLIIRHRTVLKVRRLAEENAFLVHYKMPLSR